MARRRATRPTLTVQAVDTALREAKATGKTVFAWCGMTAGFGAKCLASGHTAWIWQGDVARRTRRVTLNAQGELTLAQARRAAGDVGSRIALGENVPDARADRRETDKLTLNALTDRYFAERGPRLRERTRFDYRDLLDRNVLPKLGARPAGDLTESDVAQMHGRVTARGAARQANYTVAVLRAVCSWAVKRKLIPANPARGIELNPEHHRERVASPDEIARLQAALAAWSDRTAADAITLLMLTGARSGEVLNATWAQFDLEGAGGAVWTKPASTTKQKRTHRLPLSPIAAAMLLARQRAHPGTPLAYVFPGMSGGRMLDRELIRRWDIVRERAGLQGLKKHDLRHTAASILAGRGASLPLIGAVLGHSTPITTSRYAHLVDSATRAAVDQIAEAVSAPARPSAAITGVVPRKGGV